ncbi:hypothetical protein EPUS_06676 [Endocarpon pusillum Z07020]|uniref:Uncharacterized protein n=1 Tax=Endocarpon pusillum (strain Z07020 / HMAS-L-300199) TaxID=1263415 RepID=U1HJ93_ENDPU|nr:uncharacterized protein EPUS_06676 [Endocarpon pusillum Z07020]ERF68989.1 hypothetical protein EPUS_06676 [Endocarpon pusillum Z07020]
MAPVQSELKAKQQEAISKINELFHEQESERSRHEALLKEYAKLKDYLADRAVAYQTSLQQAKDLTEENDRLKMSLSSLTAVLSHEQAALRKESQKLKDACAQMESKVRNLGKQAQGKDDEIANWKQDLAGKPLEADGNSNTIRDSITIPLLHQMVPHEPEVKGGKGLLQFLAILGSKEQELCDKLLANITVLYSVAISQQRRCLSLLESVSRRPPNGLFRSYRAQFYAVRQFLFSYQLDERSIFMHSLARKLILNFYTQREELQGRSGGKVFPNLSGTAEGNRKRAMAEEHNLASRLKRRGELEKLVEDQKQEMQSVPN